MSKSNKNQRLHIHDRLSFNNEKWYIDEDGNMRVPVIIASTGVLEYEYVTDTGDSVIVREAKLPEELLNKHVLFSAEGKPVTDGHPSTMVNSTNYSKYAKGVFINPKIIDNKIHGELLVYDRDLQEDIKSGKKYQISPGFWSATEYKSGKYNDETYDAVQKDIYINHIAIVEEGRAGDEVKIKLDSLQLNKIKNKMENIMKIKKKDMLDKDKIDKYEQNRDMDYEENEENNDEDIENSEEENKKDPDKMKGEDQEEQKEEFSVEKLTEMITSLKKENEMLKERMNNNDSKNVSSKKIDASYMEARDFALKHVTDSSLEQYHDDVNYYRKAVVDAAGIDSSNINNIAELKGAFNAAKVLLQQTNRVDTADDSQIKKRYDSELDKELELSLKLNENFNGKRKELSEV